MEIRIEEREENPLMEREEINFEVEHKNSSTPSRAKVMESLSETLEKTEDLIVIDKLVTLHGRHVASGSARIYDSEEKLVQLEPGFLTERTEESKEKMEEAEEAEEDEQSDETQDSEEGEED